MAAVVTDQFRLSNASNFVDSVASDSYYVYLGQPSPNSPVGFGRTTDWNTNVPSPIDNLQYSGFYKNNILFGKKVNSANIRRVIKKVNWTINTRYDMYRHDYSIYNPTPNSNSSRLYDSDFYVMNSDFRVYICIDNGSSGTNLKGNNSQDEPTFTSLSPSAAGTSGDGYLWKYLFSVSPSDIIKFDSTEYIVVPNEWDSSTDPQISDVREAGNSDVQLNQIKKVYIEDGGRNYNITGSATVNILGDGTGGRVTLTSDSAGQIDSATVVDGGSGYTYGIVDLGSIQPQGGSLPFPAKLIPIIPPSKGHGYDIYSELGTDKVLIYARFDSSTKDFPVNTSFSQVGIIKNPQQSTSETTYTQSEFSALASIKLTDGFTGNPVIGAEMTQTRTDGNVAKGYVASYDSETKVLKYYQDRSLYFGNNEDQTDYNTVTSGSTVYAFESSGQTIAPFSGSVDTTFSGSVVTIGSKVINLGVTFQAGLASPEINKKTGELIYVDNRPVVNRDIRQKEDVKIILEF
tara:strand:- start:879 stop:2426 length:1548 start_codon:yes stop_codon:yes gene_type:complete